MKYFLLIITTAFFYINASAQQYRTDISVGVQIKNASFPGAVKKEEPVKPTVVSNNSNLSNSQTQTASRQSSNAVQNNNKANTSTSSLKNQESNKPQLVSDQPLQKQTTPTTIAAPVIPSQTKNESQ